MERGEDELNLVARHVPCQLLVRWLAAMAEDEICGEGNKVEVFE